MEKPDSFLYMQIAESIRRQIAAGELTPGQKLPPVRAMAQDWDCTPGTVNHAYQILTQEGLVVGQRGKGTIVSSKPGSIPRSLLGVGQAGQSCRGFYA